MTFDETIEHLKERPDLHWETDKILMLETLRIAHGLEIRRQCVLLAKVGLGLVVQGKNTIWLSEDETAIERIFKELALDMGGSLEQKLKDFINFIPKEKANEQKEGTPPEA